MNQINSFYNKKGKHALGVGVGIICEVIEAAILDIIIIV